ncbi:MAG: DUF5915 domain-containing protein, partial [Lachnospiraceae bacterium]|nr:DUF5915 domain-containing protein [Lachnospiraceae bacterium]
HEKAVVEGQRKFMSTLWNTYSFFVLYADIDEFNPTKYELNVDSLPVMDKWLLSKLNTTVKTVDDCLENYKIPESARALQDFVDEMSNWYVRRGRERYWAKGMEQDKINAYMTLYTALVTIAKAAAPLVPFITEDIYQNLVARFKDAPKSIHLCDYPTVDESLIDTKLEADMEEVLKIVTIGRAARNSSGIKNRQPIGQMYVSGKEPLSDFYVEIIEDELNIKKVDFKDDVSDMTAYTLKPQFKVLGPKYGDKINAIKNALANLDGASAMKELNEKGEMDLELPDTTITLTKADLLVEMAEKDGYQAAADGGVTVVIDTNLTEELLEEGLVREIVSKIQNMRKEAGYEVTDQITIYNDNNDRIAEVMTKNADDIKSDVLAKRIILGETKGFVKDVTINGETVTFGVERTNL